MDEISYIAFGGILLETLWRTSKCNLTILDYTNSSNILLPFAIAYILCLIVAFFDFKNMKIFQSDYTRKILSMLHACDGLIAVFMGIAMYIKRIDLLYLSLLLSTKLFLLSFVTRMVTGRASKSTLDAILNTSRAYFHHVGSFLFLADPSVIILTTIWRGLSMTGHALIAFKDKSLKPEEFRKSSSYDYYVNLVANIRQWTLVTVLIACFLTPTIRRGFG